MKKLLFSLLALSSISAFSSSYCEMKEGFTTLSIKPMSGDIRITINEYNGEEIGSLERGKITYFVSVYNPSRLDFKYMPGKKLTKELRKKGYSDKDLESKVVKIVTQDKDIVDRILAEKTGDNSLCTYGTEIVSHKPFNLKWALEREADISGPDHDNHQEYYQVVDEVKTLPCSLPLVYTSEALAAYKKYYSLDITTPEFMGEKIAVMCRIK
jgi:hypothetical protein